MATSGRYEFRNKGIDLFIDALGELNRNKNCTGKAVAFLLIPANHYGPRKDLLECTWKGMTVKEFARKAPDPQSSLCRT